MVKLSREQVHDELVSAPESYHDLLDSAGPSRLRQRTDGTRWTNREMLFHLLLGYLVVRSLLPLVFVITRLPPWVGRAFAATLNAGAKPFHLVNYLGAVAGGRVLSLHRMAWLFDRTCAALANRLARAADSGLARSMPFPPRWDPFFTDDMSLLDIYHYPWQHFDFHRKQLTLAGEG